MAQSLSFFQRNHVPRGKRADGYSTQCGDVPTAAERAAEITGQSSNISPFAALRLKAGMIRVRHVDQRQAVDVHDSWLKFRLHAVARDVIGALTVNFDGRKPRRQLFDRAQEFGQKRRDGVRRRTRIARLYDPSLSVVSVSLFTPANCETIDFAPVHHKRHRFGGISESD